MKTHSLILTLLFVSNLFLFAQTEEREKEYLSNEYQNKNITQEKYAELGKMWREMLSFFGGYPAMPYDEEKELIEFVNVLELNGIPKSVIFNRLKEWIAINFGNIDAVLHYESFESGKVIIKGVFEIPYFKQRYNFWGKVIDDEISKSVESTQTYIFTIVDNKLKIETTNIRYNFMTAGYWTGSYYRPERTNELSIHSLYPITAHPASEWKSMLSILLFTKEKINQKNLLLQYYIKNYQSDYNF